MRNLIQTLLKFIANETGEDTVSGIPFVKQWDEVMHGHGYYFTLASGSVESIVLMSDLPQQDSIIGRIDISSLASLLRNSGENVKEFGSLDDLSLWISESSSRKLAMTIPIKLDGQHLRLALSLPELNKRVSDAKK